MKEFSFEIHNRLFSGLCSSNIGEEKPLLLCLHGYLDNAASFIPVSRYLDDYRIIALDFAGHGKSFHRDQHATYHLTDYAFDIVEFLQHYPIMPAALIGHSLGGIVSSIVCSVLDFIETFVCIESAGPLTESENTTSNQLKASFESRLRLQKTSIKQPKDIQSVITARMQAGSLSQENAELLVRRNLELVSGANGDKNTKSIESDSTEQWLWRTDRKLRSTSAIRFTEAQARDVISNIKARVHLIQGNEGFEKVENFLNQRLAFFASLTRDYVDGGHHVHMDSPREVAELIKQYVHFE